MFRPFAFLAASDFLIMWLSHSFFCTYWDIYRVYSCVRVTSPIYGEAQHYIIVLDILYLDNQYFHFE